MPFDAGAFFFLALHLAAQLCSARTHRRPYPFLPSLSGAGLLAYVWNHTLEVWMWLTVMYSGVALVTLAAGLDVWLRWRRGLACQRPTGN